MPNIAGREFAYTPQGMAAAQQYKQSLGMRGGGMMGFRPVGYQEGTGPAGVEAPLELKTVVSDLYALMSKGTTAEVSAYISAHRNMLETAANNPNAFFNMLRAVMSDPQMGTGLEGSGTSPISDTDLQNLQRMAPFIGDAPRAGMSTDLYESPGVAEGPPISDTDLQNLQRITGPGVAEPEQRAHGGYMGRGTSAGELAPRGSMSVREAGETMYELAKRRRGMRGGGIMSLRR